MRDNEKEMLVTKSKDAFEAWFRKEYGMPSDVPFEWDNPYIVFGLKCWEAASPSRGAKERGARNGSAREERSTPPASESGCNGQSEPSESPPKKSWVSTWTDVIRNLPEGGQ